MSSSTKLLLQQIQDYEKSSKGMSMQTKVIIFIVVLIVCSVAYLMIGKPSDTRSDSRSTEEILTSELDMGKPPLPANDWFYLNKNNDLKINGKTKYKIATWKFSDKKWYFLSSDAHARAGGSRDRVSWSTADKDSTFVFKQCPLRTGRFQIATSSTEAAQTKKEGGAPLRQEGRILECYIGSIDEKCSLQDYKRCSDTWSLFEIGVTKVSNIDSYHIQHTDTLDTNSHGSFVVGNRRVTNIFEPHLQTLANFDGFMAFFEITDASKLPFWTIGYKDETCKIGGRETCIARDCHAKKNSKGQRQQLRRDVPFLDQDWYYKGFCQ